MYGNSHRILAYKKEVKEWTQIKFGDSRGFRKSHSFLLKCRSVTANQGMGHFDLNGCILCDGFKTPWWPDKKVEQKGVKYQKAPQKRARSRRFHNVYWEETMLMSDSLFSREALWELNTVKERPARRMLWVLWKDIAITYCSEFSNSKNLQDMCW